MELAVVKWFGGKRRDGSENDFGFVTIDNEDIHIHKSVLNKDLLKIIEEDMIIWVTRNQKGKIVEACPFQFESQEEILSALRMNFSSTQNRKLMKKLELQTLDSNVLEEQLNLENSQEIKQKLLLAYWSKATANQFMTSISQYSINELSLEMIQVIVKKPLDYNAQIEQLIRQTLSKEISYKKIQADRQFIKNYINLFAFYDVDKSLLEELLDDEILGNIIAEKVAANIPIVKNNEVLRYIDFSQYKSIPIAFWFKYESLHKRIRRKNIYPYFIQSYVNFSVGTNEIQIAMDYFNKYFFGKVEKSMPLEYWNGYVNQSLAYFPTISMLSIEKQFNYWNESTNMNVEKMLEVIKQITEKKRGDFIERLSQIYRTHPSFFSFLPVLERVELVYNQLPNNKKLWSEQEPLVKNYLIYKMTEQNVKKRTQEWLTNELIRQFGENEKHPLIKVCLRLLYAGLNKQNPNMEEAVLNPIDQVILQQANGQNGFDMLALLPRCNIKNSYVRHCEGRYIVYHNTFPDGTVEVDEVQYCPRLRKSCYLAEYVEEGGPVHMIEGSHVGPNFQLPYSYWSLQEMLTFANLEPLGETLIREKGIDYYTNKIAGWVNRLEKLIQRMKCSACSEPFKVDFEFSKRYEAAYNTTTFNCHTNEKNENLGHDYRIYLSHCYHCSQLIDSRESKYQIYKNNSYYICIHCASAGPSIEYNPPWDSTPKRKYQQGDICPKCNYRDKPMEKKNIKWRKCTSCNHEIKITT